MGEFEWLLAETNKQLPDGYEIVFVLSGRDTDQSELKLLSHHDTIMTEDESEPHWFVTIHDMVTFSEFLGAVLNKGRNTDKGTGDVDYIELAWHVARLKGDDYINEEAQKSLFKSIVDEYKSNNLEVQKKL